MPRHPVARALPLVLALGCALLAACGEREAAPAPEPPSVHLNIAPRFGTGIGGGDRPITRIRVVVLQVFNGDGIFYEPIDSTEVAVNPDALEWRIAANFPPPAEPTLVAAQVELISEAGGTRSVEWSGRSDTVTVTGTRARSVSGVTLGRGPLTNLDVFSLNVFLNRSEVVEGDSTYASTSIASGSQVNPVVFYKSLDSTIATMKTKSGPNGDPAWIAANAVGTARIVAAAGFLADTQVLTVVQRAASVVVSPDSLNIPIRTTGRFTATVRDPRGQPISPQLSGGQVFWQIANAQIAINNGDGTFTSQSTGRTTVTARSLQDQSVLGTAVLRVP